MTDQESGREPRGSGSDSRESLFQQVQKMTVTEKALLAMKGDKEARMLLIRDSNRAVQLGVIGNERITENEVIAIANSRNIDDEVLRRIAGRKEWIKVHEIRAALAKNPKTPVYIAVKLVPTLLPQEVKGIAKSKSVPNAVVQAARRQLVSKR